jgi:Xaa-Pro aminopeptidase
MKPDSLLIIADSDHDADMLYGSGLFVPDPFIFLRKNGSTHLVLSDLEIDRATRECPQSTIHSLSTLSQLAMANGIRRPSLAHIACVLLKKLRIRQVKVPFNFSLGLAQTIQSHEPEIKIATTTPFPERAIKTPTEIRKIKRILKITQQGLDAGIALIRKSKIKTKGQLFYRDQALTSERVRAEIHTVISQNGGIPCNTIVAGGEQACDPHERGHGRLKAHQPIIIDVFPRSESTGYFGDITRTVVRGKAPQAIQNLYEAVSAAQKTGLKQIRSETKAIDVHQAVQNTFVELGYRTERHKGHMQGFFHGTGHGLGLEIHESPGIGSVTQDTLRTGHVVTVEPGLYYPGIGGVRLEDVVVVQDKRPKKLTNYPHELEI